MTTNQDTQFVKLYPEEKVSEIQGDHRFFQCSRCCQDDTWDAVEPVNDMIRVMGEGTSVPAEMIPRCPHCGAEAFPWVRGYGNFLYPAEPGQEDSLSGAWRGAHDAHVYSGTLLESDA